jgi:uncharacterized membrane protein
MIKAKFDLKLFIKDSFCASLFVLVAGYILEQYFRGIMFTVVSLNFWLILSASLGFLYVYLVNKN